MDKPDEVYLFDASMYPDFERAKLLERRIRLKDPHMIEGLGVMVLSVAVLIWAALSGVASRNGLAMAALAVIAIIVTAAFFALLVVPSRSTNAPVRISGDGYLVLGDRRWALARIGKVTAFGSGGAVDIRERDGSLMAMPYRVQFGSFDDFVNALKKQRPDVEVTREAANIKVRLPKDSI